MNNAAPGLLRVDSAKSLMFPDCRANRVRKPFLGIRRSVPCQGRQGQGQGRQGIRPEIFSYPEQRGNPGASRACGEYHPGALRGTPGPSTRRTEPGGLPANMSEAMR